jgi:hypothetical protein
MNMAQAQLKMPAPPQGVIASLAAGFETVNTRLELILLPLALDLFLWLGPHLTIEPLVQRMLALLSAPAGADSTTLRNLQILRAALQEYGGSFNLFSVLSTAPLGLPSLIAGRGPTASPLGPAMTWPVDSFGVYLLLLGAFLLAGLFLGALYLGGIAQQVRDRRLSLARTLRQVWGDWARLTALAVLALLAIILLGTPILILAFVTSLFSALAGAAIWILGSTIMLWALFYAGFALHGMLLQRRGLWGALWDSARLVQTNLPPSAALFVMVVVLNAGLALVWNLPDDESWYMLLGLAGHALISTALFAATFAFYQDRYRWWTEMRQSLRARAEAERRGMRPKA